MNVLVTTSRKPVQEVRMLARELAFALHADFLTRGKAGLSDLFSGYDVVIIIGKGQKRYLLSLFHEGETVAEIPFSGYGIGERAGPRETGLVSNRPVYELIKRYVEVRPGSEGMEGLLIFDGKQKRRIVLKG